MCTAEFIAVWHGLSSTRNTRSHMYLYPTNSKHQQLQQMHAVTSSTHPAHTPWHRHTLETRRIRRRHPPHPQHWTRCAQVFSSPMGVPRASCTGAPLDRINVAQPRDNTSQCGTIRSHTLVATRSRMGLLRYPLNRHAFASQ